LADPIRLVSYRAGDSIRTASLAGGRAFDIARLTGIGNHVSMPDVIGDWDVHGPEIVAAAHGVIPDQAQLLTDLPLVAPVPRPGTIYFAGANYADHVAEMRKVPVRSAAELRSEMLPWLSVKSSATVVGPGAEIPMPEEATQLDWEAELAVIIGKKSKAVPEREALEAVFGYTISNDLSIRNLARRTGVPESSAMHFDWLNIKSFDGACPMGPWIALAGDVGDPQELPIQLSVNGVVKQASNTGQMIYSVAELISYLSRRITLWPGDVILTGTPAGVGASRGDFLKPGDEITVKIDRIGSLTHTIAPLI
jgi:2-keto-4-pentenoate hydratase/2-oxohepta-3-ene-1,7-dioic acid hydratase in catechol pathway